MTSPASLSLRRYPFARATSIEEARQVSSFAMAAARAEETDRRTPFEWHGNRAVTGPLIISTDWFRSGLRLRHEAGPGCFVLSVPLAGRAERVDGKRTLIIDSDCGALSSPPASPLVTLSAGYHGVHAAIPPHVMEEALAVLTGAPLRAPLCFEQQVSFASGAGASARSLLAFLVGELDRENGALSSPIVLSRLVEAFVYTLLSGQPHNYARLLHRTPPASGCHYIRKVEEYLEANADRPVSLADLAALTGVSGRAIQAGFRAYRGCTPMEFLRARRFELVRKGLLSASGKTVSAIALDCGFEHLGRFSVEYRARFGESPKDTLRRGLGGHPATPGEGAAAQKRSRRGPSHNG